MALHAAVAPPSRISQASAMEPGKAKFSGVLKAPSAPSPRFASVPMQGAEHGHALKSASVAKPTRTHSTGTPASSERGGAASSSPASAAGAIDRVNRAQLQLDHVFRLAQSGKTFTPAELIAFQAQVSQASNELDLAGKLVDKATGGVKQVLTTQV